MLLFQTCSEGIALCFLTFKLQTEEGTVMMNIKDFYLSFPLTTCEFLCLERFCE